MFVRALRLLFLNVRASSFLLLLLYFIHWRNVLAYKNRITCTAASVADADAADAANAAYAIVPRFDFVLLHDSLFAQASMLFTNVFFACIRIGLLISNIVCVYVYVCVKPCVHIRQFNRRCTVGWRLCASCRCQCR